MGSFRCLTAEAHLAEMRAELARAETSQHRLESVADHIHGGRQPADAKLRILTDDSLRDMALPRLAAILAGEDGCLSHAACAVEKARNISVIQIGNCEPAPLARKAVEFGRKQVASARGRVDLAARIASPSPADLADFFVVVARRVCELLKFATMPGVTAEDWEGERPAPNRVRRGVFRVYHHIPGYRLGGRYRPKEELGCLAPALCSLILQVERVLPDLPPTWPELCSIAWQLTRASDVWVARDEVIRALNHGLAPLGDSEEYGAITDDPLARWREAVRLAPLIHARVAEVLPVIRAMGNITRVQSTAKPVELTPAQSAPPPSPDQPITTGWRFVQSDSGTHWLNEKGRTIRHPSGVGIYPARCFEQIQHEPDGFTLEVRTEASDGSGAPRVDQIAGRVRKLCKRLGVNWTVRGVSETTSIVRGPSSPPPKDANKGQKRR